MGLISGILMGMIAGIALMAGWQRMMRYRSSKRIAKAVDIKRLGMLKREDLIKICGGIGGIPEWISFPEYEQVKWLNKQINKMWPFVAEAATAVVKEAVEPLLDGYRSPGITSIKLSKFFLGNVAPKIEGIRVQSLKKGQITMDLDYRWGGDLSMILQIAALGVPLTIQLKDLKVFTIIRVIFQLSEEIPCISAVVVALLSEPKPRIDYTLKAIGGSLSAVPGLSDMIDDTVQTMVSDMVEWPHRIVVPLGGVDVDISELELRPQGCLSITIVQANSLKNMETIGTSDPYVVTYVRALFKVKTKVVDNNLDPVWNETFELIVEDKETQYLILEVMDKDITQDKRLGVTKFSLARLKDDTAEEFKLELQPALDMLKVKDKKDRGNITFKALYHPYTKEQQLAAMDAEKKMLEQKEKLKEAGVIGSTMDAIDGAASLVGSGLGAGVGLVGSGIGTGVGLVGTGLGAGAGIVGTGIGAVGSGLGKAGRFMGKTVSSPFSSASKRGSRNSTSQENGGSSQG